MTTHSQAKALNFNNDKSLPLHRLPFVGKGGKGPGLSFWNVPATGGYMGGCNTGRALALVYMKHLREHDPADGGRLQAIAFSMFEDGATDDARKGQIVGFFAMLEKACFWGSRQNLNLDNFRSADLLEEANAGLEFDEEAFLASLPDDE